MSGRPKDEDVSSVVPGKIPGNVPGAEAEAADADAGGDRRDAVDANPVKQYYAEKKKRYLREGASDMKSGTPFDWEDAERYAREQDDPGG